MSVVEQYMTVIEDTASLLQRAQINLKKCPKQRLTQGYIETRLKCIEEYWNTFKEANQNLCKSTPRDKRADIPYFVNEDYFIIEDLYLCLEADLKDMLRGMQTRSKEQQSTSYSNVNVEERTSQVKLPRIEIPLFQGKYEAWATYHDLFTSLVHNNTSLSKVQKLHYLKTSTAGEAAYLLKHIQVTDNNYNQAWDILKNRYGNRRMILASILKRLFGQKKISTQSAYNIRSLLDTTSECINNLHNLSIPTDSWDPVIIYLVVQKLDLESHKEWEEYAYKENSEDLPSWTELKKFLESKFRTLELVNPYTSSSIKERPVATKERTFHATTTEKTCFMCKENHTLCHCKEFAKMDPQQRSHYVKTNNLCYNCLLPGHTVFKCRIAMTCRICHRRHHSLLHEDKNNNANTSGHLEKSLQPNVSAHFRVEERDYNTVIASNYSSNCGKETAFLATAMVTVKNKKGHTVVLRALIDQGSEQSFISEKAAQLLQLERTPIKATVVGMGSMKSQLKQVVQVQVSSKWDNNSSHHISAYVMSKQLTTKIPQRVVTGHKWQHVQGLILADPIYYKPGVIDLLLGVKVYSKIIENQLIKGPPGTPSAQKTSLGWILFGEINTAPSNEPLVVMHAQVDVEENIKIRNGNTENTVRERNKNPKFKEKCTTFMEHALQNEINIKKCTGCSYLPKHMKTIGVSCREKKQSKQMVKSSKCSYGLCQCIQKKIDVLPWWTFSAGNARKISTMKPLNPVHMSSV
ncbi:uncharacterized protein LOC131855518 [Achroia grisella]|uniref:uncharacterized protein LOC131855518 n=1 Tax=Achroia grisella TaxID=688607 RepID=UPI0027D347FA|nr:uncharacterized protein LOC131855518 [Achroia grisella]